MIYDFYTILLATVTDLIIAICVVGGIMLFLRGGDNRARKMLGAFFLLWGIGAIGRTVCIDMGQISLMFRPFRVVGLIGGNVLVVLIWFFPLEVVFPGFLNVKRLFLLYLPVILLGLIYYGGLTYLGESVENFDHYTQFFASITHFNVWFRLLFLFMVVGYIAVLMITICRYEGRYICWKKNNYTGQEYMNLSWMCWYAVCVIAIFSGWILNVVIANIWCYIIHSFIMVVSFVFFLYKGLFYEKPIRIDFFNKKATKRLNHNILGVMKMLVGVDCVEERDELSGDSFEARIPFYVEAFKTWMDYEKPYLSQDFKLIHVSRVLPLNRSYLSRLFNEGCGKNFSEIVRFYRVEYAKTLLKEHPDYPLREIAKKCGFSSLNTFIRAFRTDTNMTPGQFRGGVNHYYTNSYDCILNHFVLREGFQSLSDKILVPSE